MNTFLVFSKTGESRCGVQGRSWGEFTDCGRSGNEAQGGLRGEATKEGAHSDMVEKQEETFGCSSWLPVLKKT